MLGAVVVVLGALFVLIGVNGLVGTGRRHPRAGVEPNPEDDADIGEDGRLRHRPVAGAGSETRPTAGGRRLAAGAWVLVGVLFMVAAFTHQVP